MTAQTSTQPANLDRDTALKIALAARILPGIDVRELLGILHQRIDGAVNGESLKRVTVTDLKTSLASLDGEEDGEDIGIGLDEMKEAVRILWGDDLEDGLPVIEKMSEPMPESLRVAVASNSGDNLNGHFGSCLRYLIYQVNVQQIVLIDIRSAVQADFSDDRNGYRADLIADCDIGYFVSIGGPAAAKVVKAGIYPIKQIGGGEAPEILKRLQQTMSSSPPPWLAKILGISARDRVRCEALADI